MYMVGNTEWNIEKAHRIDDDGVLTYFRLTFTNPEAPAQSFTAVMSPRQMKAMLMRLVLEVNDIEPYEEPA